MQLIYRGVTYSHTSSSLTANNTQLCYRGAKYFPMISSPRNNVQLCYRGTKYFSADSTAMKPVATQKFTYRGTTYYRGESIAAS